MPGSEQKTFKLHTVLLSEEEEMLVLGGRSVCMTLLQDSARCGQQWPTHSEAVCAAECECTLPHSMGYVPPVTGQPCI